MSVEEIKEKFSEIFPDAAKAIVSPVHDVQYTIALAMYHAFKQGYRLGRESVEAQAG
mgnify:CR=1 FL=1